MMKRSCPRRRGHGTPRENQMPSDFEQIQTIKSQTLAVISQITAAPKPTTPPAAPTAAAPAATATAAPKPTTPPAAPTAAAPAPTVAAPAPTAAAPKPTTPPAAPTAAAPAPTVAAPQPTTPPAAGGPPKIPHTLEGRAACTGCHTVGGAGAGAPGGTGLPAGHQGRADATCTGCHSA